MDTITGTAAKKADRYAMDVMGIPSLTLMQNASSCVAGYIEENYPGKTVLIYAGTGNNGADGVCIARILKDKFDPAVVITGDLKKASWEFLFQLSEFKKCNGKVLYYEDLEELPYADVMVDAIYGIGLKGSLREPSRSVLARISSMKYPHVVAVDVPSGIDSDTGANTGEAVLAEVTITFGRMKTGLITLQGVKAAGRVIVLDIGIPDEAYLAEDQPDSH